MGVLDESDIEKISQAFKKRNIPKLFNDPAKGYKAYDLAVTVGAILIFGIAIIAVLYSAQNDSLKAENSSLNHQFDTYLSSEVVIKSKMIENADCPSLLRFYDEFADHDFTNIRSQIKDEISFRCK